MVADSGKTLCTGTFKPVNVPEPVNIDEDPSGVPAAARTPRRQAVAAIEDRWRIDDEWWRGEPVSRLYYLVLLASGQRLVLYKDLVDSRWYRQAY